MSHRLSSILAISVIALLLGGCTASVPQQRSTLSRPILPPSAGEHSDKYWWSIRFKVTWPSNKPPLWPVDLLLAHRVVEPVLTQYDQGILFWRFHRRAARDVTGHQFSFMFYASPVVASDVSNSVKENRIVEALLNENLIEHVKFDDSPRYPHIENRSDLNWSSKLQKAWPAYIMGVSAMWLELIHLHAGEVQSADVPLMLQTYRKANESIGHVWIHEGQHAFLHHLNAIFGYEPLVIKKRIGF